MNLVRAEVSRILSRRFVRLMLLLLAVTFCLTVLVVLGKSRQPTEEMWAAAREQAQNANRQLRLEYYLCIDEPTRPIASCHEPGRVEPAGFLYGVFNFAGEIQQLVYFLTAFVAFFGFLVAASSIGSELQSGSMINLLLWRPNRTAVLGAKLGVALGFVAVVSAVFSIVYVGTFYGLAAGVGWVGDTHQPGFWPGLALLCLRGTVFALAVSAIGFAIAAIARHTAAALGTLVGYFIFWELGARLIVETLDINHSNTGRDQWFLSSYAIAWMTGRQAYSLTTFAEAAMTLSIIVAASTGLAFASFRRRDIT
jgi:ABC-type transport system involved in multi-copper enzyme maturation permease subunit